MNLTQEEFRQIMNIGISLTTEKDRNKLLETILLESMRVTNCDGGTLYELEDNVLEFKVMKTFSLGISKGEAGEVIDLPPVPLKEENVCAYSALHKEVINIEDVWNNATFDFSGPKRYDSMTGYHTQSMLVIPLANHEGEVIGVMQLLNALDEDKKVVSFDADYEFIILSLASQAAIALSNMRYTEELKDQMWSFTEALATAIDERTPYNASHTRKVADYSGMLADYFEEEYKAGRGTESFDKQRKEQLVMSALLHDIGKMIVPLEVMNKPTRLDGKICEIKERFKLLKSYIYIRFEQNKLSQDEWEKTHQYLNETLAFIESVNTKGFLSDEDLAQIKELSDVTILDTEDAPVHIVTSSEIECLNIRKGTLTEEERNVMESHVTMTGKILSKVHFNRYFKDCAMWAVQHHETLDGKGYPNQINAEELAFEPRILAVADIFDALTSKDRPYKEPMPKEKAFHILDMMVADGKLDGVIVDALKKCM